MNMFSGKDAANAAYPTQWALNPSAYQNVDTNSVDWAALAQQWIAMKEAAAIVGASQTKGEVEEGEAPMEVENPDTNNDVPVAPTADWNSTNNWGGVWNQWGWGWPGAQPMDPKIAADPSMAVPPMIDGFPAGDNAAAMPGYTTGSAQQQPTFQHGYWTAPQGETATNNRSTNRSIDRRSKSKNRDSKSSRPRNNREKPPQMIPPVIEPIVMPTPVVPPTIDAAKRRQLPAWIREGLEKMEREKQRAIEREQEKKAREEAELEKKRLEEEELERIKQAAASGVPIIPVKSKFETDSEGEESGKEDVKEAVRDTMEPEKPAPEPEHPTLVKKSKEEIMQEVMLAVRRSLTEILLEVTDQEIHMVSQEELARYTAAQASRLNAMKASKSKALAAITSGLGLGAYESSDSEEEPDLDDQQLQEIIRRKKAEFERTSREIEADVRRAELEATPPHTPERPRTRSSVTPPPVDSETPEKKPERRNSKDKRSHKPTDKVDGRHLETIPEEKHKKTKHSERETSTPSPQRTEKNNKQSSTSSSDSEEDSPSSTSSESEAEKVEIVRPSKRKRRSSSSTESRKKKKQKKDKRSSDKYKKHHDDKSDKSKSRKRDDKHKSRSRDVRHRDRHDSDDDRPKKRSKRSRSVSYESRSGRRRTRDRSEDRSHRRDKHDRESSKRDRSYDRSRDYDRYDRYERSRDRERRRSRSGSHRHRRIFVMQLHIRGQSTHILDVNGEESIGQIKDRIRALSDIGSEELVLSACGAPLEDAVLVSELQSTDLDLTVPLLGGKVHGSLARAGKVKGQTPKVEKQQKKKKKTGRAKRRIQYNRRFVNVVQTFGRRRGPNSNS
ncbi:arginine/serine-rich protein PNISR-like isoform X2 [Aricia agestis]|uniref:arginine/serine-rich protein PNISR-like isoform X2 n=2 Tax=Aricia agestis TaxID=91739 RepID=UPI001C207481|nr:arginine/serine-rich protein PNISR-like isoform X2 [Aricia agestis]